MEGKIRRIAELLEVRLPLAVREARTIVACSMRLTRCSAPPIEHRKPTPVEEANTIIDIFDSTLFDTILQVPLLRRLVAGRSGGLVPPACLMFFHPAADRFGPRRQPERHR